MNDNIIAKILEKESKSLLETALLISDDKQQAANLLNDLLDITLRKLWQS